MRPINASVCGVQGQQRSVLIQHRNPAPSTSAATQRGIFENARLDTQRNAAKKTRRQSGHRADKNVVHRAP